MEIKIGVRHNTREIVVETSEAKEILTEKVTKAIEDGSILEIMDDKGNTTLIPGGQITSNSVATPSATWASASAPNRRIAPSTPRPPRFTRGAAGRCASAGPLAVFLAPFRVPPARLHNGREGRTPQPPDGAFRSNPG